jgi:translation elongation factor EF-Ts
MITQDDAEKAVDWLRANARKMAQERAERLYLEQWIKTVKATLQTEQVGTSAAASEIAALASPKYLAALQAYKQAVEGDEYNRFMVTAAEAKIEAWRSQESTRRAEGKAYA